MVQNQIVYRSTAHNFTVSAVYRWYWAMYYKLLINHLNNLRMAMVIVVWWVFMH